MTLMTFMPRAMFFLQLSPNQDPTSTTTKKNTISPYFIDKTFCHVLNSTCQLNIHHPEFIRAEFWSRLRAPVSRSTSYESGSGDGGTISFRMCDFGPSSKLPERQNKNTAHTSRSEAAPRPLLSGVTMTLKLCCIYTTGVFSILFLIAGIALDVSHVFPHIFQSLVETVSILFLANVS